MALCPMYDRPLGFENTTSRTSTGYQHIYIRPGSGRPRKIPEIIDD